MKILIGIPSARDWKGATGVSFALAFAELTHMIGKGNVEIYNQPSPNLPNSREMMVMAAIEGGFDRLIFFDDDMYVPQNAFVRLIKHDKDVVGIDYSKKRLKPYETTACADEEGNYEKLYNCIGMQKAGNMGFGAVCIKVDVLKQLDQPMFMPNWYPELKCYSTEDTPFFEQLREKGFTLWVDMDLSMKCKHIGDCHYEIKTVPNDSVKRHKENCANAEPKIKMKYLELLNGTRS